MHMYAKPRDHVYKLSAVSLSHILFTLLLPIVSIYFIHTDRHPFKPLETSNYGQVF